MKVTFVEDPTPHLLLEDVYSEDQLSILWKEIEILTPSLDPPSETGSAWHEDDDKTLKKQNEGLFLTQCPVVFSCNSQHLLFSSFAWA